MSKRYKLWEVGRRLTATAQGKQKADLVIKNGMLVNVFTREIQPNIDVTVVFGRFGTFENANCRADE